MQFGQVELSPCCGSPRYIWGVMGNNGCCSDTQIFNECQLRQSVMDRAIDFPETDLLASADRDVPYFILADDAFTLRTWLMKPFSG